MGRVEYKGAQYNRSGLNYIRDIDKYKEQYPEGVVYDFIEITGSGRKELGGFKRANRQNWIFPDLKRARFQLLKQNTLIKIILNSIHSIGLEKKAAYGRSIIRQMIMKNYHAYVTGSKWDVCSAQIRHMI